VRKVGAIYAVREPLSRWMCRARAFFHSTDEFRGSGQQEPPGSCEQPNTRVGTPLALRRQDAMHRFWCTTRGMTFH